MIRNKLLYLILAAVGFSSCEFIKKQQLGDAIVRVGNEVLYQSDIDNITSHATTAEDSTRLADAYIRSWASDALLFDKAYKSADNTKKIEAQVADYRRQLYVHQYEKKLIEQRMSHYVSDDTVADYYETHKADFLLGENIVRGVFISLPQDAPDKEMLKRQMQDLSDENLELIEKYVWQYATGYQLFLDDWQKWNTLLSYLPEMQSNKNILRQTDPIIELNDSTTTYLIRLTDKLFAGETMPLEYAKSEIEELLLSERKINFLKQQEEEMYESAIRQGKIIIKSKQ